MGFVSSLQGRGHLKIAQWPDFCIRLELYYIDKEFRIQESGVRIKTFHTTIISLKRLRAEIRVFLAKRWQLLSEHAESPERSRRVVNPEFCRRGRSDKMSVSVCACPAIAPKERRRICLRLIKTHLPSNLNLFFIFETSYSYLES